METEEEIQSVLQEDGILLDFSSFEICAIRSTHAEYLRQEPALAEVEQLIFEFMVSTKDVVDSELADTALFTFTDGSYIYTMSVNGTPVPFTDGWSKMLAEYVTRELV